MARFLFLKLFDIFYVWYLFSLSFFLRSWSELSPRCWPPGEDVQGSKAADDGAGPVPATDRQERENGAEENSHY